MNKVCKSYMDFYYTYGRMPQNEKEFAKFALGI